MRRGVVLAAALFPMALLLGCQQPYQVFAVQIAKAAPPEAPSRLTAPTAVAKLAPQQRKRGRSQAWDLNRAPASALLRLPGISQAEVALVIAARPYRTKRQLLKRGIFSAAQYAKWKDFLVVHRLSPRRPKRTSSG